MVSVEQVVNVLHRCAVDGRLMFFGTNRDTVASAIAFDPSKERHAFMPKIAFIGAGSTVFAKNLLGDILSFPEFADADIALFDIDPERLRTSEIVAQRVAAALNVQPTITATTERRAALDGADYAICMIQVGGYKPSTVVDFEIPKRYGLRQTIADTLGIGGIMRGLRTFPSCSTCAAIWRRSARM